MNVNKLNRWLPAVLLLGCGSRLQVDQVPPGGAGSGGGGAIVDSGGGGSGGGWLPEGGGASPVTDPPAHGSLGQTCIPSATTTEASGSVAQADITTPDHCAEGLTCGSDGLCGPIPDCPQASGICVVHRDNDQGAGGTVGAGGYGHGGAPAGTGGGSAFNAIAESGVQDLKANDTHLYWVDYGTRDSLGNYKNDGALMAVPLAGGAPTALASTLPGPVALGLTSTHAYVYVDGAPLIGSPLHSQLLRLPLAGGAPELVQDGTAPNWSRQVFVGAGDQAFWSTETALYSQAPDAGALPGVFLPHPGYQLDADATDLYYTDCDCSVGPDSSVALWRAPLGGAAPQSLLPPPVPYGLRGDSIYGIESVDNVGIILDQAAKSGGTWQRIRALGAGNPGGLQIVGDRYFVSSSPPRTGQYYGTREDVLTASLGSTAAPVRLLETSVTPNTSLLWVGSASALYWTDGNTIYSFSLAGLP